MKQQMSTLLTFVLLLFTVSVFAQTRTVTGNVTDDDGDPAIAATVVVTGTEIGTVTDIEGNFSLDVPEDAETLTISYIGMRPQTIPVSETMSVSLVQGDNVIDDVVVTALGLEKKPRNLSYSVDNVSSDQVTKTSASNVATVLSGKVSGMQVNTTNNGVSPDTRVVLRGSRSILGNNEALIVVDGYPSSRGTLDRINPNDIESFTILKGANASALYGSDASNGAVIITTKKGTQPGLNVTYTGSYQIDAVSYMPEFQDQFGPGFNGVLYPLENINWGPEFDGSMVDASETLDNGDVWQVPYSPIEDNHRNFFDNAPTSRNGITLTSGGEGQSFLLSFDHTDTKGIVPQDEYNRTNVRLKATKEIDRFTASGNFSFFRSGTDVVGAGGRQGRPVYWNVLNTPLHIPLSEMENWRDGTFTRNETSFYAFYENPYFIIDTQREESSYNEFTAIGDLSYEILDGLSATTRVGYTNSGSDFKRKFGGLDYNEGFIPSNPYNRMQEYGASTVGNVRTGMRLNADTYLQFQRDLSTDLTLDAVVGHNYRTVTTDVTQVSGSELIIPGFWNISTRTGEATPLEESTQYRKIGAYSSVDLGFKDYVFLNLTARNDWSSTLPTDNNSYFYPGAGLAVILSDAIPSLQDNSTLSFLKASFNAAKTGRDPVVYQTNNEFVANSGFPFNNAVGLALSPTEPNPNLNPEFTESLEAGLQFGLFADRIRGNVSLFQTNTIDQIIEIQTSLASGAGENVVNLGEVQSQGLEVDLGLGVIENYDKNLFWDVNLNYFTNRSEVLSLNEGVDQVSIGGYETAQIIAEVGSPFPLIRTDHYERDPQGRIIVGANGDPVKAAGLETQGQTTPKHQLGLNTNLEYKNWNLYAAGDYRTGHVFFNDIVWAMEFTGLNNHSATSGRQPFVFPNSSYSDGQGGYVANTNRLTSGAGYSWWNNVYDVASNYVYDASFWKLREVGLSYTMPTSFLSNYNIEGITIGAFGRNLITALPAENEYTDPEFNFTTGNAVGVGTRAQTPPTRSFGVNLNVNF